MHLSDERLCNIIRWRKIRAFNKYINYENTTIRSRDIAVLLIRLLITVVYP